MFITFEGIEGCGKTTQAKRLVDRLIDLEIPAILTLEPGGTRICQDIRNILLNTKNKALSPLAELLLYAADRAQHVGEMITPALSQGKWVVCDRFFDATVAYQGYARGQDIHLIRTLNEKACSGIRPDMTVLVDCPVEVGLERALKRNKMLGQEEQARFEKEKTEFHEAVRRGYLSIAEEEPDRFVVVDGTLTVNDLGIEIFEHIRPYVSNDRGF
ncbi:MAG: dTMP kinase [Deltaproteobacteria bacterium]|nr:dTMP kinase [Deltaproteobacteria bacterium]MBW2217523.1 dTMP kinase [Deltaproteobacteria bacterium]